MADPVAIVSVVSSGIVAIGGLVVSYRSGREQRDHEKRLSFEGRVWETKSEGLFGVIAATRSLLDTMDNPEQRERLGVVVADVTRALDEHVPVVETYASRECRETFDSLRMLLKNAGADPMASEWIAMIRREKEEAIDAGDFEEAAKQRDRERETLRKSTESLTLDRDETHRLARRVIETARDSLRGEG